MSFYELYIKSLSKVVLDSAEQVINSKRSWEEKYDLIFSEEYSKEFNRLNPTFEYCDPDSSYEDDALAWFREAKYFALWNPDLTMGKFNR